MCDGQGQEQEQTFVNVHTHIFTKEHVPEYIARQFIPSPLHKWIKTSWVAEKLKEFYLPPDGHFSYTQRNRRWVLYKAKIKVVRNPFLRFGKNLFQWIVWILFSYYLLQLMEPIIINTWIGKLLLDVFSILDKWLYRFDNKWNLILILVCVTLAFDFVRRSLWLFIKNIFLKWIGKERFEFLMRYISIIRYANYKGQNGIFKKLIKQYPPKTKFVILPMDMEFMEAGPVKESYPKQMSDLMDLRKSNEDSVFPFVFVDPRRIELQDKNAPFVNFEISNPNEIRLSECLLKTYFKDGAIGVKIYPALGYYPFDRNLLPLWLYCSQNNIPITTHCSVGPIFYRGEKKKEWDRHPIFKEVISGSTEKNNLKVEHLRLQQIKNKDFQANFTHPLNYCCLLIPELLIQLLELYNDPNLNALFGYANGTIERDLSGLKINLAHYGGSEHWDQFVSKDRQLEANEILSRPDIGLNLKKEIGEYANLYSFWHYTDWFSLITSMILEFENVYADISYTAHDNQYLNLLSELLNRPKIQERILFGTDFYVVSNNKTEKAYWIEMKNLLGNQQWLQLANTNPNSFLNLT